MPTDSATVQLPWGEKLRFHVAQAKLCAETGNFAYFHDSRAQYIAKGVDYHATLQAQNVSDEDLQKLRELNIASTEASETSVTELESDVKGIKVDDDLSPDVKKLEWRKRILEKIEVAKKKVIDAMDAAGSKAIEVISALPESAQDTATTFFNNGMDIAMEAFDYLVARIGELWNWIVDFIQGIWTALEDTWNAVSNFVNDCVSRLWPWKSSLQTNGVDDIDATSAPQATQSLVSLAYNPRLSHHDITTSTNRIWTTFLGKHYKVTSRDPQNVNISPRPISTRSGDTKDKLMFIYCQFDGDIEPRQRRELMDEVCRSEERSLADSKGTGALKYNIVDMAAPPKSLQLK